MEIQLTQDEYDDYLINGHYQFCDNCGHNKQAHHLTYHDGKDFGLIFQKSVPCGRCYNRPRCEEFSDFAQFIIDERKNAAARD